MNTKLSKNACANNSLQPLVSLILFFKDFAAYTPALGKSLWDNNFTYNYIYTYTYTYMCVCVFEYNFICMIIYVCVCVCV